MVFFSSAKAVQISTVQQTMECSSLTANIAEGAGRFYSLVNIGVIGKHQ